MNRSSAGLRDVRNLTGDPRRIGLVVPAAVVLALAWGAPSRASQAADAPLKQTTCAERVFSVRAPGPGQGAYTVAGELCSKRPTNREILLITAHGATYNHRYWDWPQDPAQYSFVRSQAARVSVLNIDLLGSGESSRPPSLHVTQEAQASVIHQLVQRMRARGFKRIVLVGHSSGSGVITLEAATYRDVDGLIVTGFLHRFAPPPGGAEVPLSMYPAAFDSAYASMNLDPGYLTTRPGTRGNPGFYNKAVADPNVIAYDDAHKDVVTATQVAGFAALVNEPSISRAVSVPVLSLVGDHDGGFCDSPACPQAADESAAWSPAAELELHVIPHAGHNIHLHGGPYARAEYSYVRAWLQRRFK